VLKIAAQRIVQSLRNQDIVARIGGDEFVVFLERVRSNEAAATIADKIINAFVKPIEIAPDQSFEIGISIGIALSHQHGNDLELLLLKADNAMYRAKQRSNRHVVVASE